MKDWQQIFDSYRDSWPSLHGHPLQHLSKEITCPLLLQLPPLHLAPQPPLKWKHFVFIKTDAILNSSHPSTTSAAVTLTPTQRPFTSVATLDSTQPPVTSAATVNASWPTTALQIDLLGANVGNGVVFLLEHVTVNHWQPKQKRCVFLVLLTLVYFINSSVWTTPW